MKRTVGIVLVILIVAAAASGVWLRRNGEPPASGPRLSAQPAPADLSGFARVTEPRPFVFPADHGPHLEYQTEWWYFTGNLVTAEGRRFGYQLTFFRRALLPAGEAPERQSDWASGQVYMAHFALSDIETGQYHAFERLGRGAAGLAGAQAQPLHVWLEDWQAAQAAPDPQRCSPRAPEPCVMNLTAAEGDVALELSLAVAKPEALQGDRGYSRKGAEPGQASYYYSLTRLDSVGTVTAGGQRYEVTGWSWMDHEWSTSALSKDQQGWDWFSIQLDQGGELMVFQIRREDGSIDPFSSGLWVHPDGSFTPLGRDDFAIEVTDTWRSPHSGATYPAGWRVGVPSAGLSLEVLPRMADQELNVSYAYWEGAVAVTGVHNDAPVSGGGYVELTGYSESLGGDF
jgi:predicted secreted hydrolase